MTDPSTHTITKLHLPPQPDQGREASATHFEAATTLMAALSGLLATCPSDTIGLELTATPDTATFILAIPTSWHPEALHQLYAAFPNSYAQTLDDDPLCGLLNPSPVAAAIITPATPQSQLRDTDFQTDPLQPVFELLSHVPDNATLTLQLVLTASTPATLLSRFAQDMGEAFKDHLRATIAGPKEESKPQSKNQEDDKTKAPLRANLRAYATAPTISQASDLVRRATAAYQHYAAPGQAPLRATTPRTLTKWLPRALNRLFDPQTAFYLTHTEAANLYHPALAPRSYPKLTALPSRQLPPPAGLSPDGLTIGQSTYRGTGNVVRLSSSDRLRHAYIIGQTGTGKSTLIQSAILQDIAAGEGCCFIDPHGEAIDWLLPRIPAHRAQDVVLFDPSDPAGLLGLNLLEWHTPHERDLLIQELILLFYKLFDPTHTGIIGPQFEHWLRSAALTITEPTIRGTLVDIPRLFTDTDFSRAVVARAQHPAVKDFWHGQMAQTAATHKSEMLNYFTSKFGGFLGNTTMRQILSQRVSAFDLRALMDRRKILLVNLSKGRLGPLNAQLLGGLIMAKLQQAALSRADIAPQHRVPFYVYIDEFQNIATDTFASMLSEIRKYGVGLHLAHQYMDQLPEPIQRAVTGNIGTIMAFRLGATDANWLAPHFAPLTAADLTGLPSHHFHLRTLTDGQLATPFTVQAVRAHATPRPEVEQAIRARVRAYVQAVATRVNAKTP